MAATKTRRRRRTTSAPPVPGKTSWVILNVNGDVLRETGYGAAVTLKLAQARALDQDDPVTYTVERRDLFGPPALLYRVDRDEDGIVLTTTISEED